MKAQRNCSTIPGLFYRAREFTPCRIVRDGVRDEVDGREDQRNHAPRTEQQVLALKVPKLRRDAGLAEIGFEPPRLTENHHADISLELDVGDLTHTSTELAAAYRVHVVKRSRAGHLTSICSLKVDRFLVVADLPLKST